MVIVGDVFVNAGGGSIENKGVLMKGQGARQSANKRRVTQRKAEVGHRGRVFAQVHVKGLAYVGGDWRSQLSLLIDRCGFGEGDVSNRRLSTASQTRGSGAQHTASYHGKQNQRSWKHRARGDTECLLVGAGDQPYHVGHNHTLVEPCTTVLVPASRFV